MFEKQDVLQIQGIQQTLAELNKYDKVYRRQVTKDIKGAGAPIIEALLEVVKVLDLLRAVLLPLAVLLILPRKAPLPSRLVPQLKPLLLRQLAPPLREAHVCSTARRNLPKVFR